MSGTTPPKRLTTDTPIAAFGRNRSRQPAFAKASADRSAGGSRQ